jgi:hypothetical protein
VVIACGSEILVRHARSYDREELVFDPRHYLALLEQKIGALDQATPLEAKMLNQANRARSSDEILDYRMMITILQDGWPSLHIRPHFFRRIARYS